MTRPLYTIAQEIAKDWQRPYFGAVPYVRALGELSSINDEYGCDTASSVVACFLSNAATWRGETARRVKKELHEMLKNFYAGRR